MSFCNVDILPIKTLAKMPATRPTTMSAVPADLTRRISSADGPPLEARPWARARRKQTSSVLASAYTPFPAVPTAMASNTIP
jgi:hypothetical protein